MSSKKTAIEFKKGMLVFSVLFSMILGGTLSYSAEIDDIKGAIEKKGAKWVAEENSISRLPKEERKKRLGASEGGVTSETPVQQPLEDQIFVSASPSNYDWRNVSGKNYVTPVRNQGSCGSCWAFAVTAALESKALITFDWPGTNLNLSEQIVVSCSGAGSCSGGSTTTASNYLKNTGINLEACYPYTATNGNCNTSCQNWRDTTYKIGSWSYVSSGSSPTASTLKNAIYDNGPVVVVFDVYSDFFSYRSGVYSYTSGSYEGGHAVLAVGWNDTDNAFIVKNSWGTGWGESGYFRIAYSELSGTTKFARYSYTYGNALPAGFPYLSPSDGIAKCSIIPDLDWQDSAGATSYDIYFGTTNPPPFLKNNLSSSFRPEMLNYGTNYYWKIVAKNNVSSTTGPVWSFSTIKDHSYKVDFDGDGKTDVAIYRSSIGGWFIVPSSPSGTPYAVGWGGETSDIPVPGDYDGDGRTDFAFYRSNLGQWYVINSSSGTISSVSWGGNLSHVPVPGDYDGDKKTDITIYDTTSGAWWINPSSGAPGYGVGWGGSAFIPVPEDYDGDGRTDIAVYDTLGGGWWILPSAGAPGYGIGWGGPGFTPLPGDFDGDGKTDMAVYGTNTGAWYVIPSGGGSPYGVGWGGSGFKPVPGDYDGDGRTDIAVYRTSTGAWYVYPSGGGSPYGIGWGGDASDVPLSTNPD